MINIIRFTETIQNYTNLHGFHKSYCYFPSKVEATLLEHSMIATHISFYIWFKAHNTSNKIKIKLFLSKMTYYAYEM